MAINFLPGQERQMALLQTPQQWDTEPPPAPEVAAAAQPAFAGALAGAAGRALRPRPPKLGGSAFLRPAPAPGSLVMPWDVGAGGMSAQPPPAPRAGMPKRHDPVDVDLDAPVGVPSGEGAQGAGPRQAPGRPRAPLYTNADLDRVGGQGPNFVTPESETEALEGQAYHSRLRSAIEDPTGQGKRDRDKQRLLAEFQQHMATIDDWEANGGDPEVAEQARARLQDQFDRAAELIDPRFDRSFGGGGGF